MKLEQPAILVIIGISGDLSRRKLLPALYQLEREDLIGKLKIVGTSRRDISLDGLRDQVHAAIVDKFGECHDEYLDRLLNRLELAQVDTSESQALDDLNSRLEATEKQFGRCATRLFYLAIPPAIFPEIAERIGSRGLDHCRHDSPGRLLVEKPFGQDLESAVQLDKLLKKYFDETQIYRIDHFLAKETAQNVVYFRFMNPLVDDLFSSKFIDHAQITMAEEIDIEGRVDFYEQTGALKDVVQSHLLQLLALITIKDPRMTFSQGTRQARQMALEQVNPVNLKNVVLGQYEGYQQTVENKQSQVETFVALKLSLEMQEWRSTPIYLRTGKALKEKFTEINLIYKPHDESRGSTNILTFRIQPNEGIAIKLTAKKPGLVEAGQEVVMDYCYQRSGHDIYHDAYQKLLVDAMNANQALFPSSGEVEASWKILDPLIKAIKAGQLQPEKYAPGSWGPQAAADLVKRDGRGWIEHKHAICALPSPGITS